MVDLEKYKEELQNHGSNSSSPDKIKQEEHDAHDNAGVVDG